MAERRMFTKKITDDDHFIGLSSSAQALYLHLTMSADDDGFCNNVAMCIFKAHASAQDLQALIERRFLIAFQNGVIVIKHWRMANALRSDRYTPTAFRDEKAMLELKDNKAYTLKTAEIPNGLPVGCQTGAKRLPQNRIEENRIEDNNICAQSARSCTVLEEFNTLWSMYPAGRKQGKERAYKAYVKARETGEDYETVRSGLAAYVAYITRERTETRYVKMAQTWFAGHCWKDEYGEPESETSYDRQAFYEAAKKRGEGDDNE